jgi:hypothetical protein
VATGTLRNTHMYVVPVYPLGDEHHQRRLSHPNPTNGLGLTSGRGWGSWLAQVRPRGSRVPVSEEDSVQPPDRLQIRLAGGPHGGVSLAV